MNDRAVSVLSEYEFEVIRTWKGRGAILFETPEGLRILKEYTGPVGRLDKQSRLLSAIRSGSDLPVEEILPNKEGVLWTKDQNQDVYIVKTYFEGRECSIRDMKECHAAAQILARLHRVMKLPPQDEDILTGARMDKEYEKHNRELKKIRRFLREKGQKNDFEIFLLKYYDVFMEKAFAVAKRWQEDAAKAEASDKPPLLDWCHGDYQYHNLLFDEHDISVVNFEKCICDSQIRDLYLFLRKLLEKNNWSAFVGDGLLEAYQKEKTITAEEMKQLYYRLAYPEKFWKIVNFYYNSGKAWVPGRNAEKLEKLLQQEKEKEQFLKELLPMERT